MGDSPKWVKSKRRRKKKRERKKEKAKVGENNGQATHGARKHAWRTQAAWAKNHKCIENGIEVQIREIIQENCNRHLVKECILLAMLGSINIIIGT